MSEEGKHFYEFGAFRLDTANRLLLRDGRVVPLKPKVVETLLILVEKNGSVVEKNELHERLWKDTFVEEGNLTQNIYLLRKALGDESGESRFIETIPRRGYRFAADLTEPEAESAAAPAISDVPPAVEEIGFVAEKEEAVSSSEISQLKSETELFPQISAAPSTPKSVWRFSKMAVFAVTLLLIVSVAGVYFWRASKSQTTIAETGSVRSIAVLPFKDLSPETDNFMGAGMADALITKLSSVADLKVPTTGTVLKYAARETDSLAAGRELNAETVLDGSIQRSQNSIRVNVRLIRVSDGASLWTGQFDENYTNIFAVQDSISEQVARALTSRLSTAEHERLRKHYTENAAAYEAYLKGRYFWNKRTTDGYDKAIEFFQQAINLDSNYALAYAGLADCYMRLNENGLPPSEATAPRAKAFALKALTIDDTLAEAHATLGFISFRFDRDFPTAEREFKKALELDPSYAIAHQWFAFYLLTAGNQAEALNELNRARELDPLSLNINSGLGTFYYFTRQYDQAAEQLQKTLELDANFAEAHWILGLVYEQQNQIEKAAEQFEFLQNKSGSRSVAVTASLAHLYVIGSKSNETRQMLNELLEKSKQTYVSAYDIAVIYAGLGEQNQALDWLEKANGEQSLRPAWAKFDPRLDPLRKSPRFQNLFR